MTMQDISLSDRYDLEKSPVLLNGTQALVRLMLMQKARDRQAGLNTAGYVTGYRGSPLGAVDLQMARAGKLLEAADVRFQPGLNEDLAATALWGSQQAELRGEGRYDGVFGLWYGKGPGVDRSGDVMRHANMAGTSPNGGVLMAMGDDHTGESSTTLHQSEWALVDAYMPIMNPAGVQEILDYGLFGYALSRFSGMWVGLKCMKDTVEATSVVDGDPFRLQFRTPQFTMPEGGLNIRLADTPVAQEARIIDYKRFAAEAFARANRIDKRVLGKPGAKIGFAAAGKNWLDLVHALQLLGIGEAEAERLGVTTYKIGMTWPLDEQSFNAWADGLDLIVVVEEKRKLIEVQVKEAIFNDRRGRRVYGWRNERGEELFPARFALDPVMIAEKIGAILIEEGRATDRMRGALAKLAEARKADNAPDVAARLPYFCSGCPHNSSTRLPEGARAYAGIGCHYMVQWMDRETVGFTQMGGEGANWIGEAPFSTREHVFQNLGDGTYNHSGLQAVRAAVAAGTNITFKLLYNDAVAMTGGQTNDGGLDAHRIIAELRAMGVSPVVVVHDEKEGFDTSRLPSDVTARPRDELMTVQEELGQTKGVSALVYVQTCAAEKRRRRKRGTFPDPDTRVFINPEVCEGCGDCGVQSNCVSIVPEETELGRKRAIDQNSCNKDYSCLKGFCPSFVTVEGAKLKKSATRKITRPHMDEPALPAIDGTCNVVITGIGGTGVVTVGAVLAMAAHLDGKGAGMMEMAGLAQKGGAVHIHCRLAEKPQDISAIRVAIGEADVLLGGDLVVSAGSKTLGLMTKDRTAAVVNSHEVMTGDFARNREFRIPFERLEMTLGARLGDGLSMFDATVLARALLGDSIYSNMLLLGAAWQRGLIPLSHAAITRAITLNGTAVEGNVEAFEYGRWCAVDPQGAAGLAADASGQAGPHPVRRSGEEAIAFRAGHLRDYQSARLARRYRALVARFDDPDLRDAVARGYHKLLSYKDEYEVARLHLDTGARLRREFDGDLKLRYHLAPPLLSRPGPDGRPRKRAFGSWMGTAFRLLAPFKRLRGTPFDPFGYSAERRMERQLIRQYEQDMDEVLSGLSPENRDAAIALAELPLSIRGFGPVKEEAARVAARRRDEILKAFRDPAAPMRAAAE
ncbi:indolepyruvate ferredoxin oxidoreductase [Brevirhabdus pacifica]|uniref:Indolepyruvate ferredoxin oxidoreductase n=1 Tax=Brevirhabdus pacifica TaxID=1267768 RepID=A0A1U7DFM9_9RHOB|nr:indolepyruvate ferredoxin oxidoreductase family protein [Brevirhabdus pacifica]APX88804.1 indolepyruvate ferredoxin oxidoreductase [Brevirhabdus pacifica]OWU80054.1 indolepyruvate ferredoxin oxidoreductase [Loktanella sp. 22II-4b]PJJ86665.1 indolepyruvate ferredoxin oxidoreductase [Brevirhabdus pacifica]